MISINDEGTTAELKQDMAMPRGYYELIVPALLRQDIQSLSPARRSELERVGRLCRDNEQGDTELAERLLDRILPGTAKKRGEATVTVESLLAENGFDRIAHQQIREDCWAVALGSRKTDCLRQQRSRTFIRTISSMRGALRRKVF